MGYLVNLTRRQVFISIIGFYFLVASADRYNKFNQRHIKIDLDGYPSWFSSVDRTLLTTLKIGSQVQPNVTVAKDGAGQYKTVTEGINSYPENHQGRYIVYVKTGIYKEYITVNKSSIFLYGDGPDNTIITGRKNKHEGIDMPLTYTFAALAPDFIAKSITFENTAGPEGEQAVALLVASDHSAFFNCAFRGYQDTLYMQRGRQFYSTCEIYGTIDFIYGHSTTLIQNSRIWLRKPIIGQSNVVVADGRESSLQSGIVIQNCSIKPDAELIPFLSMVKTYLARPWQPFSTAVFIQNYFDDFIERDGYMNWTVKHPNIENSFFAEFGNTGPGANATSRVKWAKGIITKKEASKFTAQPWLDAITWIPSTGIPYNPGFET